MLDAGRTVRKAHPLWMALILGLMGCGEVIGIDDWQQGAGGAGGAGGTSANAATGQGGAQSSSTASGMTGSEVCSNAVDDDADGKVDCADSDCAGYTCAPAVPADWSGPVAVVLGMPGDMLPPCGPEWATETDFLAGTLTAPDAQCSACDCEAPAGGQCNLSPGASFSFYKDLVCTDPGGTTPLGANQCTLAASGSGFAVNAYKVTAAASASGGSCAAIGGLPAIQPASFDKIARICEGPTRGGGCGTPDSCVPPPPPAFREALCIYRQVDNDPNPTCPTGYNPLTMLYTGITDMRICSACQCGSPAGRSCKPTAYIYFNQMCTGGVVQTLDYCNALAGPVFSASMRVQLDPGAPMDGDCNPTGPSVPTGEAYGTSATLACCLP